jgi:hypothetical protein
MTEQSCFSCKNESLFEQNFVCQNCYSSVHSRVDDLKRDLAFVKQQNEKLAEVIRNQNKEIAGLKQTALPLGDE